MKIIKTKPVITVDKDGLQKAGISEEELKKYLPSYTIESFIFKCGLFRYFCLHFFRLFLVNLAKLVLRPRPEKAGNLDIEEVNAVYDREAKSYDFKHHMTTRGMDITWRRWAAWCVASLARKMGRVKVLDLCTGTGLAVQEMVRLLPQWSIKAEIVGIDYNENMLSVARLRKLGGSDINVEFVRGNAMDLVGAPQDESGELARIEQASCDVVTQMFGIGGISHPQLVFQSVIQLLKPGGRYFVIDMHQPIPNQPGEWPLFFKWLRFPVFETIAYNQSTIPVVLNRLWGWRDTTADFYLLPLTSFRGKDGKCWGFEVISMETESQRWWFSLPLMSTAKIIVQKVEIDKDEYDKRQKILSLITVV